MSYEAERAIAKAALDGPDDGSCGCEACWPPAAEFWSTFNPEFCLGLLDKLERYKGAWSEVNDLFPGASSGVGEDGGWVWKEEWTAFEDAFQKHSATLNPTEAKNG